MVLTLAWSSDDRALAIRDRLLPLVRERGTVEVQRGPVRLTTLETGPWVLHHWTPFSDLSPDEASSPGYRHALERQHDRLDLPYGSRSGTGRRWYSAYCGRTTAPSRSSASSAAPGRTRRSGSRREAGRIGWQTTRAGDRPTGRKMATHPTTSKTSGQSRANACPVHPRCSGPQPPRSSYRHFDRRVRPISTRWLMSVKRRPGHRCPAFSAAACRPWPASGTAATHARQQR